ncbi:glycoside hydrolase family 65 protein [Roseomonas aeriglobus]|nr:glycoside hydrolase family 65 protein [Roseomonas aeriglobus]
MMEARPLPVPDPDASPYGGDSWRLTADAAALAFEQTPPLLSLGNGFIGLRGPGGRDEPTLYLNGVYEEQPIPYHEAAHGYARSSDTRLATADPTRLRILVDGRPLRAWDEAELDMAAGRLRLSASLGAVRVTLDRLVAMDRDAVFTRIRAEGPVGTPLSVVPHILPPPGPEAPDADAPYDPRVGPALARSPWQALLTADHHRVDRLPVSGWQVAVCVSGGGAIDIGAAGIAQIDVVAGIAAARDASPDTLIATARAVTAIDFDTACTAQCAWFDAIWRVVGIDLPDTVGGTRAMRHALFQLIQAAGRDGRTSLAAKGQTGEGYEGHVFWDADSYALPVLALVAPDIARAMLRWRIAGLDDARANARAMGQTRGALYPWRTIGGRECSSFFPAGSAQYHINADIAHALRLYVATTGDTAIFDEGGAEMLAETARIWLQIGWHDPARGDAFVINRVTGPDEYSAIVDNNLYTNLMAAEHLRFAATVAGAHLSADEVAAMRRAADAMAVPFDAERNIPAQDDRFFALEPWPFAATLPDKYPLLIHYHPLTIYRHRVAKQADAVLAAAILPRRFDRDTRTRMLDVYEAVTVHDSTLSAAPFAMLAASVGDADRALAYWRRSVMTDLSNLFANSGHGLHMAALAGAWSALVYGFAGMTVLDGLGFAPIAMPALGGYAFGILWHGSALKVTVSDTRVRYTLDSGGPVAFRHSDEALTIACGETIERAM